MTKYIWITVQCGTITVQDPSCFIENECLWGAAADCMGWGRCWWQCWHLAALRRRAISLHWHHRVVYKQLYRPPGKKSKQRGTGMVRKKHLMNLWDSEIHEVQCLWTKETYAECCCHGPEAAAVQCCYYWPKLHCAVHVPKSLANGLLLWFCVSRSSLYFVQVNQKDKQEVWRC